MLPQNILQSNVLDIIFDNRNKAYGAYELRRHYNKRLYAALITVGCTVLLFALIDQFNTPSSKNHHSLISNKDTVLLVQLSNVPQQPVKGKLKNNTRLLKPMTEATYTRPVITNDALVKDTIATTDDLLHKQIGIKNISGEPVSPSLIALPPSTGNGNAVIKEKAPEISATPFEHVEIMPQFPGGAEAFKRFLLRNIDQPDDINVGEEIITRVRFVVQADGSISGIEVLKTGRTDLDAEVMRVLQKMPRWAPGMQNGKNVAVYFVLPVTFMGRE